MFSLGWLFILILGLVSRECLNPVARFDAPSLPTTVPDLPGVISRRLPFSYVFIPPLFFGSFANLKLNELESGEGMMFMSTLGLVLINSMTLDHLSISSVKKHHLGSSVPFSIESRSNCEIVVSYFIFSSSFLTIVKVLCTSIKSCFNYIPLAKRKFTSTLSNKFFSNKAGSMNVSN
jgi:hypothetical protein